MMPMPPAFDTADASWARAIHPIGACTIGYSIPSISVMRFSMGLVMHFSTCADKSLALAHAPGSGLIKVLGVTSEVNRCEARLDQLDDQLDTTKKHHRHATRRGVLIGRSQRPLNLGSRCSWYRRCRRSISACLRPTAAADRCCRSGVDKLRLASQKGRWMPTRKCRFSRKQRQSNDGREVLAVR